MGRMVGILRLELEREGNYEEEEENDMQKHREVPQHTRL